MMNPTDKQALLNRVQEGMDKFDSQLESISAQRGMHEDVIRMITPVMKDMLELVGDVVKAID